MEAQQASNAMTESKPRPADARKLRVAVVGIGWWSDVLADAALRSDAIDIAACYTRSDDKRAAFAAKYGCRTAASYEDILTDRDIEAVINTTPNSAHLATTRMAPEAGTHGSLHKPIPHPAPPHPQL